VGAVRGGAGSSEARQCTPHGGTSEYCSAAVWLMRRRVVGPSFVTPTYEGVPLLLQQVDSLVQRHVGLRKVKDLFRPRA
jgi:hypothetical protein